MDQQDLEKLLKENNELLKGVQKTLDKVRRYFLTNTIISIILVLLPLIIGYVLLKFLPAIVQALVPPELRQGLPDFSKISNLQNLLKNFSNFLPK